jgi:Immunity protein 50
MDTKVMTNSSWLDFLVDASAIRSVFGDQVPTLENIDLHEVVLHRDGPRVLLRFDLSQFPSHPPKKWAFAGFNRVQVRLLAVGVRELAILGLQSECKLSLNVLAEGASIRIRTQEGATKIDLVADCLVVDGLSAYLDR